jgi:Rrf2 family protein
MALRLSTRCRYGVYALFDLAYHSAGGPAQVKDVARRQHIPPAYLEQIFASLRRARIVSSKRGPAGGYRLAQPIDEITVGDVIRATEGALALVDDFGPLGPGARHAATCGAAPTCVWRDLDRAVAEAFDKVTVGDFCRRGEALGIHRGAAELAAEEEVS